MKKFDLTHARHDSAFCLAPNLFVSLMRGERKKRKLDVLYQYNEQESLRFIGFEPLDAFDMRVLQGLIATAGGFGFTLTCEPISEDAKVLRKLLKSTDSGDALVVKESLTWLLREIGLTDSGRNIKNLKESITRMSNVTIIATSLKGEASYNLLSYTICNETNLTMIAINPRISAAVLGGSHSRIDMNEVRSNIGDVSRLVHQRLIAWVDKSKERKVSLDTLCGYAWSDLESISKSSYSMRRKRMRDALDELRKIGWRFEEYAKNKFEVKRPR